MKEKMQVCSIWLPLIWIYVAFPHLGKYAKKSLDFPLPTPRLLRLHTTKSNKIIESDPFKYKGGATKMVHTYLTPTVRETKRSYMATLEPYTDEEKDTIIDALKANLKGVIVLTSVVENEEDEVLCNNNSNQPCENSVSTVDEDYTTPTVDEDGVVVDVDEILALAIVNENLVAVDAYFVENDRKNKWKRRCQKKKKENKRINWKRTNKKKKRSWKRRNKKKMKRRRLKRRKKNKNKRISWKRRKKNKKNRRSWKRM
ncbi:hypothetical protein H5410_050468 [Solanum commersonii]|uniref:Uncharacterized protein n=1 Tax=Solanum commersonii TaxID=4109 RepID=A0A9J5WVJ5_SOLCO|nr:hypothetical protein H5410_050468 [Solanum commersonii]